MNHDTELHERSVDCTTAGVDDVYIILTHRLLDPYLGLANTAACDFCLGQGKTNARRTGRDQSIAVTDRLENKWRRSVRGLKKETA